MAKATFEHDGNVGTLTMHTHFDVTVEISCEKTSGEIFRLGGTAVNEVMVYEAVILNLSSPFSRCEFRAFFDEENSFEGTGLRSVEDWTNADLHCWVTEYYSLDMEGKKPGWFISKKPICEANNLFVNLDVLDGGGNILKRYRVSPFTGEHKVMENLNV